MNRKTLSTPMIGLALGLLLLAACGMPEPSPAGIQATSASAPTTTTATQALESPAATQVPITRTAHEIASLGSSCSELYKSHIDAWDSREPENLRQVYTEDIVHFDGEPLYVDIDGVVDMAKQMYKQFPNWQMEAGATYISEEQCLGTWINWGVFGLKQSDPGLEYDLMNIRSGRISYWRLFYDPGFFKAMLGIVTGGAIIDDDFLSQFASRWSGGDAAELVKIYSQDAELEDSLFGISIVGQQAIADYANWFFARSPGGAWELLYSFAESDASDPYKQQYPFPSQGGVFGIMGKDAGGNPCEIRAAVILTPNDELEFR
jgi:hypothetical protein